jgi:hypothetical protein
MPTSTPKPANTSTWDRYKPGTIAQIVRNTQDELTALADQAFYYNFGNDYASKVVATYTGQFRRTSELRTLLIGGWFEAVVDRFSKADGINLFATEGLFVEDAIEYWLPIQGPLIPLMKDELTEGKPVTLFIIWMGATFFDNELDRVFLVNEFLARPGAIPTLSSETRPAPTIEPAATPQSTRLTVTVSANVVWYDTKIKITKGQSITFLASGSVNTWGGADVSNSGPNGQGTTCPSVDPAKSLDCLINGEPYGKLIGRIGHGTPFPIGTSLNVIAPSTGILYLAINENEPYFEDNSGSYKVRVTVK